METFSNMELFIYSLLLILGTTLCDHPDVPPEFEDFQNKINEIPGLENFNKNAPSLEEVLDKVKSECEKNGGELAFDKLTTARNEIEQCIESNFNFTQIEIELTEKRKTGSMDDVFAKYCGKRSIVDACVKNFTEALSPCLENVQKAGLKLLLNVTNNLIDFGCYKDGDRIAMFLAEGGLECIRNKTDGISDCFNKTLGTHFSPETFSLSNLPFLIMNEQGCEDFSNLHSCITGVLEKCHDHTPANLVDAAFKYTRRSTHCKNYKKATPAGNHRVYRRDVPTQELHALQEAYNKLKQKYDPHCLQNGGQRASTEFREALMYVERCQNAEQVKFSQKNEEVRGISYDYMCKDFRSGLRRCLTNLTSKMEKCSNPSEKYVPKFGLEIYDSVFKYQCKDEARALKMLIGEQDSCTKTILSSTDSCVGKTKHIKDYSKEAVVTKTELCSDLKLLRKCFRDMASQHCPNNNNVNDLVKGFSDAIYAPCAACSMFSNLILIFVVFLLSKLF